MPDGNGNHPSEDPFFRKPPPCLACKKNKITFEEITCLLKRLNQADEATFNCIDFEAEKTLPGASKSP